MTSYLHGKNNTGYLTPSWWRSRRISIGRLSSATLQTKKQISLPVSRMTTIQPNNWLGKKCCEMKMSTNNRQASQDNMIWNVMTAATLRKQAVDVTENYNVKPATQRPSLPASLSTKRQKRIVRFTNKEIKRMLLQSVREHNSHVADSGKKMKLIRNSSILSGRTFHWI